MAGSLNYFTRAYPIGRAYIRRIYDLIGGRPNHFWATMNKEVKEDLKVWLTSLELKVAPRSFIEAKPEWGDDIKLFTNASRVRVGGFWQGQYFAAGWRKGVAEDQEKASTAWLEIIGVAIAVELWGDKLKNRHVVLHCDSQAVVEMVNKLTSKSARCMAFVRRIAEMEMRNNLRIQLKYIESKKNEIADALSRLQFSRFHKIVEGDQVYRMHLPIGPWTEYLNMQVSSTD